MLRPLSDNKAAATKMAIRISSATMAAVSVTKRALHKGRPQRSIRVGGKAAGAATGVGAGCDKVASPWCICASATVASAFSAWPCGACCPGWLGPLAAPAHEGLVSMMMHLQAVHARIDQAGANIGQRIAGKHKHGGKQRYAQQ